MRAVLMVAVIFGLIYWLALTLIAAGVAYAVTGASFGCFFAANARYAS